MLAVVPERPNSRASDFISATTPARAAATIASPDSPTREESPITAMMRPFFAALEMRRRGVAAMDRAVEAGVDLAAPVLRRGLDEALAQREPGIVDEDVRAAEILDDRRDHRGHGGEIRDVGLIGLRLAAGRRDLG